MGEKQELIKKMLEMQKAFIKREHESGLDPEEYYSPGDAGSLGGYNEEYTRLANRLVEIAHQEKGSTR